MGALGPLLDGGDRTGVSKGVFDAMRYDREKVKVK